MIKLNIKMDSNKELISRINQSLMIGWIIIVMVLFFSYCGEVAKGQRTLAYMGVFSLFTILPALLTFIKYKKQPELYELRYYIVIGYFMMYIFVMFTGSTTMVFSYILPMLSFLVLYHEPKMILTTGACALIINIISIAFKFFNGMVTVENSKDIEIQIALIVLCFTGSYFATRIYNDITNANAEYLDMLDKKTQQIQKMTIQTITTVANTIDAKDDYTQGHSKRVAGYSAEIAREMGCSEARIEQIHSIALLHDIGKIGVPDAVLNKPGKLTNLEYDMMKMHTVVGAEILKDIDMLPEIDVGARYHHERYDGKGYPDGLSGDRIPMVARIIAVADAYDAMTSSRVYRKHLEAGVVMAELEKGKGTQFDPQVVEALITLIREKRLRKSTLLREECAKVPDSGTVLSRVMEKNEEKIINEMRFDSLTGAYNRSFGENTIAGLMERSFGCLAFFDIDHFRYVNNTKGFVVGDMYLQAVIQCIKRLSDKVVVARFGSDEFAAFFTNVTKKEEAEAIAERYYEYQKEIMEQNPQLEDLSVSLGMALSLRLRENFRDIFLRTDKALYMVKQSGGGTWYIDNQENIKGDEGTNTQADIDHFLQNYESICIQYANKGAVAILFTALCNENVKVSVEEKEKAMSFLKRAIVIAAPQCAEIVDYSGVQKLIFLADKEEKEAAYIATKITHEFYKMYNDKKMHLRFDKINLKNR